MLRLVRLQGLFPETNAFIIEFLQSENLERVATLLALKTFLPMLCGPLKMDMGFGSVHHLPQHSTH